MSSDTAEKKEQDIDDHHSKMVDHENTVVGQGGKGELECLKEMPVDIILEIFGNLDPIDLLHLSRISKGLRDMLTSSNAIYLWHLVRPNFSFWHVRTPMTRPVSHTVIYKAHVRGRRPAQLIPISYVTQDSCTKLTAR